MTDATIGIAIDGSKAVSGARTVRRSLDDVKQGADQGTSSVNKLQSTLGGVGGAMRSLAGLAASLGVALGLREILNATIRQEQALAQLNAAIRSTGGAAGLTSRELSKLAGEIQAVTTFGDEAVMEMQALLLTFTKIGRETFPQATKSIVDMATRMRTDLSSAALQVGKALNDPILGVTALGRAGVQFTQAQKDVIKELVNTGRTAAAQTVILKELETQFGGSAEAARNTLGGALTALGNAIGDTMEAGTGATEPLRLAIEAVTRNLDGLVSAIVVAGGALAGFAVGQILTYLSSLALGFGSVTAAVSALTVAISANPIGLFATVLGLAAGAYLAFGNSARSASGGVESYSDALATANDATKEANDLGKTAAQVARDTARERNENALAIVNEERALLATRIARERERLSQRAAAMPGVENTSRLLEALEQRFNTASQAATALSGKVDELAKPAPPPFGGLDDAAGKAKEKLDALRMSIADLKAQQDALMGSAGLDTLVDIQDAQAARDLLLDMGKAAKLTTTDIAAIEKATGTTLATLTEMVKEERVRKDIVEAITKARRAEADLMIQDLSTPDPVLDTKYRDDLIESLDLELAKKTELAGLQHLNEEARLTEVALIEAKYRALAAGKPLDDAELRSIRERIAAITKLDVAAAKAEKATQDAAREAEKMIDDVTRYAGDLFADMMGENRGNWRDMLGDMERWAIQTFARIAAEAIIRPQIQAVFGASGAGGAGGAGALGGSSQALGLGGSFGSYGGLIGGASSAMALGNVLFNGASLTGGSAVVGNAFASVGNMLGGAELGASFGNAGMAFSSPIGSIGSFAANMALNAILGDRGMGANIGSTIGAIGGSFLGPWGTVAGSAIGNIIGGMFGGQKPTVGPNAYAESFVGGGGYRPWESAADNGGDAAGLVTLSQQVATGFTDIVRSLGGTLDAAEEINFHLGNFPSQGGIWAAVGGTAGRQSFGQDSEAAIRFIFAELLDKLEIDGLGAEFEAAATKAIRLADSTEQMTADLEFLRAYFDDGILSEEAKSAGEQFMDALTEAFDEARGTVTRLGLGMGRLEEMRTDAIAEFIAGFNQAQLDIIGAVEDPMGQRLVEFERMADALRKEAAYLEQFGADVTLIERRIALERQQIIEQFGRNATDSLRAWLDGQALTSTATTAMGRLAEAQAQFGTALDAARGGDTSSDTLSQLTRLADAIIRSGAELYGGTAQNAALEAMVRSQIASLIPGYADGGMHAGGWRIVGERGPELEYTGPSYIASASQTRAMVAGGGGGGVDKEDVRQIGRMLVEIREELRRIGNGDDDVKSDLRKMVRKFDGFTNVAGQPKRKAS